MSGEQRITWCDGCYPWKVTSPRMLCDWCLAWYGWIVTQADRGATRRGDSHARGLAAQREDADVEDPAQ